VFCSKAQLIVVGTLRNVERDVHFLPSQINFGGKELRSYFDEGDLDVEEILRGELSSRRIRITWYHHDWIYPPGKNMVSSDAEEQFDNGLRGVWIFTDTSNKLWGCQRPLFVSMEGLARVKAILSGDTKNIYR